VNQGSLLVALDDPASTDVARSLARLVIDSGFQPLRILGMEQEVGSLLRELQTLASFPVREQRNSLLQVLTRETLSKTGEARPGLQMRLARPDDLSLLLDWKCRFRIDALGDDPSWLNLEVMKASLELSLREQHQYVLEAEGRLVSMARLNARTTHHAQLGGVYTPREERGRGYASWLTAALCRDCLDGGVDAVTLMVEAEKRTANLIYERIGFQTRGIYTFLLLIPLGKDLG
jgi:predicted GNAT family acetyltransferase